MGEDIWIERGKLFWFKCSCRCWLICFDNNSSWAHFISSWLHLTAIAVLTNVSLLLLILNTGNDGCMGDKDAICVIDTLTRVHCMTVNIVPASTLKHLAWIDVGCTTSTSSYNLLPTLPYSSIFRSMQMDSSSLHAKESTQLQQQGNKFSLSLSFLERQKFMFVVSSNWNKWGDFMAQNRPSSLYWVPPTTHPFLHWLHGECQWWSQPQGAMALRCCIQPLSSLTSPYFIRLILQPPLSLLPLLSGRQLPSSHWWFHRLVAAPLHRRCWLTWPHSRQLGDPSLAKWMLWFLSSRWRVGLLASWCQ